MLLRIKREEIGALNQSQGSIGRELLVHLVDCARESIKPHARFGVRLRCHYTDLINSFVTECDTLYEQYSDGELRPVNLQTSDLDLSRWKRIWNLLDMQFEVL